MGNPLFDLEAPSKEQEEAAKKTQEKPMFLMSSDSFSSCGLDLVFELTKQAGFDGIDLAIRKNFDARNVDYVKKLSTKHELPIKIIQVSDNVNEKELNKALDLCEATGADTITINAPKFFNTKAFSFLEDNLENYKKDNKHIHFSIINPESSSVFALPIPKFRFSNIVEIIKKYGCYLALDISNFEADIFENDFLRKLQNFLPYVSVIYFSDKNRAGEHHLLPGDGTLKLESFLKKTKQYHYHRHISAKVNINKSDLADSEKLEKLLKKTRTYFQEYFEDISLDE